MRKFIAVLVMGFFIVSCQQISFAAPKSDPTLPNKITEAIKKLGSPNKTDQKKAFKDLVEFGTNAVDQLNGVLNDKNSDKEVVAYTCDILGEINDAKAVDPLILILNHRSAKARYSAARALGNLKDKRATGHLVSVLDDEDYMVREFSVIALGKILDLTAVSPVIKKLTDSNGTVRAAAAKTLGQFADKQAVPALIKCLSNDDFAEARCNCADALGIIKDPEATQALIGALRNDYDYKTRGASAFALGEIRAQEALPFLIDALKDEYKDVQVFAGESLNKITGLSHGRNQGMWREWFKMQSPANK